MESQSKKRGPDPTKLLDMANERIKTAYQASVSSNGGALSDTIEAVRLVIAALREGDWSA